jgi:hypothetical protein
MGAGCPTLLSSRKTGILCFSVSWNPQHVDSKEHIVSLLNGLLLAVKSILELDPQYNFIYPSRCEASVPQVGIIIEIFVFQYKLEHFAKFLNNVYCLQPYSNCRKTLLQFNCSAVHFITL